MFSCIGSAATTKTKVTSMIEDIVLGIAFVVAVFPLMAVIIVVTGFVGGFICEFVKFLQVVWTHKRH